MIRLVATDLDGTVVRWDGTVSERTRRALAAVERAGLRLVFVTGRPPRWMHRVAEATGHRGLAVCANGAAVYDLHSEQVVESYCLTADAAADAAARVRAVLPQAAFAVETLDGFGHEPTYQPRWPTGPEARVAPLRRLLDRPVAKLLVRVEGMLGDAMLETVRPALEGAAEVTHSNDRDGLLELSAPGVSKASTLALLAAEWGIAPPEVVAFGDMPNDVPMLRWAGTGYAVAGGHPLALAAADAVVGSADEDGVAATLERLLG